MGAPVVVDAEPAWHRAADLAVVLGADVGDTSDAEGKMCFIFLFVDCAPCVHADDVKHTLCDVDTNYVNISLHGTRLLWLHGCDDRLHHTGLSKPIRIGADPLHENQPE